MTTAAASIAAASAIPSAVSSRRGGAGAATPAAPHGAQRATAAPAADRGREPAIAERSTRSAIAAASGSWVTITTARPAQPAEQLQDRGAVVGVEAPGRLVGQHELRVVDERAGDREPLLLAARQLARQVTGDVAQAELVDQPAARRAPPPARPAAGSAAARSRRR